MSSRKLGADAADASHPCGAARLLVSRRGGLYLRLDEAFRQLLNGRPQPVGLECPADIWAERAAVEPPTAPASRQALPLDEDAIEAAARLIGKAKRPLIVVGGGAQEASAEVTALAELLQALVVAFRTGHGVVDSRNPLSVTVPIGHQLWRDADVVLGIGTRLQTQQVSWGVDDDLKIVRFDIDPIEVNRLGRPEVAVIGYVEDTLPALLNRLPAHLAKRPSRAEEMRALKADLAERIAKLQPQLAYLEAIRAELPEDGILVDELVQPSYVARIAFPVHHPRTFICSGYQGTLGWSVATAIGVQMARPDRKVVALAGDGGFMFNVQELATAVQQRLPLVIVLFNDGAYGNVRRTQKEMFGNRVIATDLQNPDFVKLADSFGAKGMRAASPAALRSTLREALKEDGPVVIEVLCGEMPNPWEFMLLPPARGNGVGARVF
jgi:acetolactate synthase-1/2/3 large subunit